MYVFLSMRTEQNNDCTQSLSCISQLLEKSIIYFFPWIFVMHVEGKVWSLIQETYKYLSTRKFQINSEKNVSHIAKHTNPSDSKYKLVCGDWKKAHTPNVK